MAEHMNMATDRSGGLLAGAWTNVILGLLIAAVPFFTAESGTAFWNNVIVGLAIAVLAGYNAWASRNATGSVAWVAGINLLLGLWLIVSPFFFAVGTTHLWADVILGVIVALVAGYNAWAAASTPRRANYRPGV